MKKLASAVAVAMAFGSQAAIAEEPVIALGGVTEVEAESTDDGSNIAVATFELEMAARVNERVTSEVVFLYEDDGDTPFGVDTATVNMAMAEGFDIVAGRTFIPFGVYESHMLADPLTLELGETGATVVQADFSRGPLTLSAYTFNGPNDDEDMDNGGLNIGYADGPVAATVGYLANLGDSDAMALETIDSSVPGLSASLALGFGNVSLLGEYVTAQDDFSDGDSGEAEFDEKAQPSATMLEVGYSVGLTTFAVGVQSSNEAEAIGLAEKRTLATISHEFMEHSTLSLQYSDDEDYAGESESAVTAQLAVEF